VKNVSEWGSVPIIRIMSIHRYFPIYVDSMDLILAKKRADARRLNLRMQGIMAQNN